MKLSLIVLSLSILLGCTTVKREPVYINTKLSLEPLNVEILQLMQPDSTELLKEAETWYRDSELLLDSVN